LFKKKFDERKKNMICASCNGSGKYIGLSSSEDCKDCLGKGTIIDKNKIHRMATYI